MNLRTGESAPVQAARMFMVPITLFSWASAGRGHQRVDDQPGVDHRVDLGRPDDALQQRVLVGDLHELGALELARGGVVVDADDRLDVLEALQGLRQAATPVGGEPGDEHAAGALVRGAAGLASAPLGPGGAQPSQTDFLLASISCRFSWIWARISCARVWTSALSSAASAPPSSAVSIGARKRILNLAGR